MRKLSEEDRVNIKNNLIFNIEEHVFEYIRQYLKRHLSGYEKSDFIDELKSNGIYKSGDNIATTLNISREKITFSLTGDIQLIVDEDVLQFRDQSETK